MQVINSENKEVCLKVLYLGARGAGKTSNFRSLFTSVTAQDSKRNFHGQEDDSLFFEFLPLSLGKIQDHDVRVHLFSFELDSPFSTLRKMIFTNLDACVFVIDSRMEQLLDNRDLMVLAKDRLKEEGYKLAEMPHIFQFNRRDDRTAISSNVLSMEFNRWEAPEQDAVANQGQGVLETLQTLLRRVLDRQFPDYSHFQLHHIPETEKDLSL